MPSKSAEHEEVKWFKEIPEDPDPRLKGLL